MSNQRHTQLLQLLVIYCIDLPEQKLKNKQKLLLENALKFRTWL